MTSPRLRYQLRSNQKPRQVPGILNKRILLAMVELHHYQFLQMLTIAKALQLRGADVLVLVCDKSLPGCEIKSSTNQHLSDPCWECQFNKKNIFRLFGLPNISYSDVLNDTDKRLIDKLVNEFNEDTEKVVYKNHDLTRCIEDSVIRYFYGGEAKNKAIHSKLRSQHIETALKNIITSENIDATWKPDAVLCNMTAYSTWNPIYEYFGERIKTVSLTDLNPKAITYNFHEVLLNRDRFEKYYEARESKILTRREKMELDTYLKNRFAGEDWLFKKDQFYTSNDEQTEIDGLGIDPSKRNIFLFSNLYWDTGLSDKAVLFEDVISWVLKTIEFVKDRNDINLYIKTHPAEEYSTVKSKKTVKSIIEQKYPNGIGNVTIIDPKRKIKPYSLFPYIDVAVLFQGTLGWELLKAGVPVISCAIAAYNGMGFVHEPQTLSAYKKSLMSAGKLKADKDLLDVFLYFFFMRVTAFPWEQSDSVYGNKIYNPLNIKSCDDLNLGSSKKLDFLCELIASDTNLIPENW